MARKYTLDKSNITGYWRWGCKDGPGVGSSPSKHEARQEAKKACKNGIIIPPDVDVIGYRGYLSHFSIRNLDDQKTTFSVQEISEEEFTFFFGLPCSVYAKISDARKAITILKIWGIYRGGLNKETIMKIHFMSEEDFKKIVSRDYLNGVIIIEDDGKIIWKLPK